MKISLCIITLNEQDNLRRCLESANGLVDETIVVDSGSTDGTELIAMEFDATWIQRSWPGFVQQKNFAISQASHDWILCLDADEALSVELRSELLKLKNDDAESDQVHGYSVPRCVYYEGRWIRHGDWYPDRLVRLFRNGRGKYQGGKVHERLELDGEPVILNGELEHYSFKDKADHRQRSRKYAQLWAETKFESGETAWLGKGFLHGIHRFVRGFLLRGGFMDGRLGLQIAWLSAQEVVMKYGLLREMNNSGRDRTGVHG